MTQDIKDLIVTLMRSVGNYSQRRITSKNDKLAYIRAMKECIAVVQSNVIKDHHDIGINLLYSKHSGSKSNRWHLFSNPRYYNQLAHEHAIEIAEALIKRFVTGCGDETFRGWKEISSYTEDSPI